MELSGEVTTEDLRSLLSGLGSMGVAADDGERIERVRLFEELKAALCAAQVAEAVAFGRSQRAGQARVGEPVERQGRGVAAQLGLALRVSPYRAQRWLGFARIVTVELPATLAELAAGRTSEWRAMLIARETAVLSRDDRSRVDRELAPRLGSLGDREVEQQARRAAYRLDPHAALARTRRAVADRHVAIRPLPDAMCRLSVVAPVAQGVAAYAALTRHADTHVGAGAETRGRGQVMADTLIERVTGQTTGAGRVEDTSADADRGAGGAVVDGPESADGVDEPGWLLGYGPIPAGLARELAYGTSGTWPEISQANTDEHSDLGGKLLEYAEVADRSRRRIRRLYLHPDTGQLATMDSRRRDFPPGLQHYLRLRDRLCRTPYCGAPTPTTSTPTHEADPPAFTTPAASAKPATTPTRHPAGPAARTPTAPSPPAPPPATPTRADPNPYPCVQKSRTTNNDLARPPPEPQRRQRTVARTASCQTVSTEKYSL